MQSQSTSVLTVLLLFLFLQQSFGQSNPSDLPNPVVGKITGTVTDADTRKGLEFATISLYNYADSLLTGAITDSDGAFELSKIPEGKYYAKIYFMGYESHKSDSLHISSSQTFINLNRISLSPSPQGADVVEIKAEKSLLQLGLDKKVFNVEKSDLANAENATEVLRSTPSVEVDKDEAVKVRGKVVQVYINGKPTGLTGENQAAILRQIPANTIKSIEIITNPSAKESPEGGSSGIINIVMKKNTLQGFTGSVNAGVGTNAAAFRKEDAQGPWVNKYNSGFSLNYKSNKINIFTNINANQRGSFSFSETYRHNFQTDSSYYFNTYNNTLRNNQSIWGRAGMDIYLNDLNTLSFQVHSSPSRFDSESIMRYDNFDRDSIYTGMDKRLNLSNSNSNNWTYNVVYSIIIPEKDSTGKANLDKVGQMGENRELVFDLQYIDNKSQNNSDFSNLHYSRLGEFLNTAPDSQSIFTGSPHQELTFKTDYTHPFSKNKARLEVGYHFIWRLDGRDFDYENYDSHTESMVNDTSRSNDFKYIQQIHALYGTYSHQLSKKWSAKFGLRLEQVFVNSYLETTNETFRLKYFGVYPTLHFSYQMNESQQMTFSFSRRVQRPWIWSVNPFPSYNDPRYLWYGNPYLKPSYTNSLEVNYGKYWGQNSISVGLFGNYATGEWEYIQAVDSIGVISSSPQNLGYNYQVGLEFSGNFQLTKIWSLNGSASVYQSYTDASKIDKSLSFSSLGGYSNFSTNVRFKFGLSLSVGASTWFQLREIQGRSIPNVWHWLSVSQQLLKKNLTLSIWFQNPFFVNQWRNYSQTAFFTTYSRSQWEARVLNVSARYNFGKVNVKKPRKSNLQNRMGGGDGGGGAPGGQ